MTKVKKLSLVALAVFAALAVALLCVMPKADVAYAAETDKYSADAVVTLPEDGVLATVVYLDGGSPATKEYKLADGKANTRENVNEVLASAWKTAVSYSRDLNRHLPADNRFGGSDSRVEMHLYVDWIAVNGKFGSGSDAFDGGELELDGYADANLLLDLHGCTLDRGSTRDKQYGRIFDIYNEGSVFFMVSTGSQGVVTGGWDEEGGGLRVGSASDIYLENIHVTGNHGEIGGAVYVKNGSSFFANNCEFSYNEASDRGGAIGNEGKFLLQVAQTKLTGCSIHHNVSAGRGGGVDIHDTASVFSVAYNHITDCEIYANRAGAEGGGVFVECDSDLHLKGSTRIYGNHSNAEGGGVFVEAYANDDAGIHLFDDVAVFGNTSYDANPITSNFHLDTGTTSNGVLYLDKSFNPTIASGVRAENNDQVVAKAQYEDGLPDSLRASEWFFADRTDQYVDQDYSKVVVKKKPSKVGGVEAFGCTVAGGAFDGVAPELVEINNDTHEVTLVFPERVGTAKLPDTFNLKVTASLTENSQMDLNSDGIDEGEDNLLEIDRTEPYAGFFKVWNQEATANQQWAVKVLTKGDHDADLVMTVKYGSTVERFYTTSHPAPFEAGWNAAVGAAQSLSDVQGNAGLVEVTLHQDWVAQGDSFGKGLGFSDGRIALDEGKVILDLNGCAIDRNLSSERDSGQVFRLDDSACLALCDKSEDGDGVITGGNNTGNGGAFYLVGEAILDLGGVRIAGNHCGDNGAGIYVGEDATVALGSGSVIEGNEAGESGGGVYVAGDGELLIYERALVEGNKADNGGGIAGVGNAVVKVVGGTITGNTATENGGGLLWTSKGQNGEGGLFLSGGNITSNIASRAGGGVFASSDGCDIHLGGTVCILGNAVVSASQSKTSNLCLEDEDANLNHIVATPLSDGASIGVNMFKFDGSDLISASGSKFAENSHQHFFADDLACTVEHDSEGSGNNTNRIYLKSTSGTLTQQTTTVNVHKWVNGEVDTDETATQAPAVGQTLLLTPETVENAAFLGWKIVVGSTETFIMSSTLAYAVPALDSGAVDIYAMYAGFVSSVAISNVVQPVTYAAFDCDANVVVTLPFDGSDDDTNPDTVTFDNAVVTWTDENGRRVNWPDASGVYTGTIVLEDNPANAMIFADGVAVSGPDGATGAATARVEDGKCTITFSMKAKNAKVTADLAEDEALSVARGTSIDQVRSQLPASYEVTVDASEGFEDAAGAGEGAEGAIGAGKNLKVAVDVTWDCVTEGGYKPETAGEYAFKATFHLDTAGLDANGKSLTATAEVEVSASKVAAPMVSVQPGVYEESPVEVGLSTLSDGAAIYYTTDGSDPVVPTSGAGTGGDALAGKAALASEAGAGEAVPTGEQDEASGTKKYTEAIQLTGVTGKSVETTIKAVAVLDDQRSNTAEFKYTISLPVTVKVAGGTLADGTREGKFLSGMAASLIADNMGGDKVFLGWYNGDATTPESMKPVYTIIVGDTNLTYTAKFADDEITSLGMVVVPPAANKPLEDASCTYTFENRDAIVGVVPTVWFAQDENGEWQELDPGAVAQRGVSYKAVLPFSGTFSESLKLTLNGNEVTEGWDGANKTFSCEFPPACAEYVSHENPADKTVEKAGSYESLGLPATVKVTVSDGTQADIAVVWPTGALPSDGKLAVTGKLSESDLAANFISGGENAVVTMNVTVNEFVAEGGAAGESSGDGIANTGDGTGLIAAALGVVAVLAAAAMVLVARRRLG